MGNWLHGDGNKKPARRENFRPLNKAELFNGLICHVEGWAVGSSFIYKEERAGQALIENTDFPKTYLVPFDRLLAIGHRLSWDERRKIMKEQKRERKLKETENNLRLLAEAGVNFELKNKNIARIQEDGKPEVDFYLSVGTWRPLSHQTAIPGGVKTFLNWYAKQGGRG